MNLPYANILVISRSIRKHECNKYNLIAKKGKPIVEADNLTANVDKLVVEVDNLTAKIGKLIANVGNQTMDYWKIVRRSRSNTGHSIRAQKNY